MSREYLDDAQGFVGLSSIHIKKMMTPAESIQGALLFAVGIEKLLKYLLADINPVFILKVADFKHSAPSLYRDRIVSKQRNDEISLKPNSDVITYRVSLNRAKAFSQAANKYGQLLYSIASWRDLIVHRPTAELDTKRVSLMLQKDAISLVDAFAQELAIPMSEFYRPTELTRLSALSKELTDRDRFEKDMEELLAKHRKDWQAISPDAERVMRARETTSAAYAETGEDHMHEEVTSPACENTCIVRVEPDYDYADGESYLAGVYASRLHCYYCGLNIEDYEALEYVGVDELLASDRDDA